MASAQVQETGATSVEVLSSVLANLLREREEMRRRGESPVALERNRLAIVRCQQELPRALIARHA